MQATFTIIITTKNRLEDLKFTLEQISSLLALPNVSTLICDDGSTDATSEFIQKNYPNIHLIQHQKSLGLIASRNELMSLVQSDYAISIDDDLHFLSEQPLHQIEQYFQQNPKCGLVGFRIFWSKQPPLSQQTSDVSLRMKSFAGGAHAWRMSAWRAISGYPAWFVFHGEEDFAAYELFKKDIEIHYLPSVLVHHRVDLKARKNNADYAIRLRRSLRSGWSLYLMFFPMNRIPRLLAYSIWMQLKSRVFKGDYRALKALILAGFDLITFGPKIIKNANRLSEKEYQEFEKIENIRLYWKPEK
ncbi:glycosyltransferase family 2 protein [Flavobacterium sp. CYK-55]|uniref:glycosyltransferase family 2 protein n=1 Tax=Flavobacterium sp. CYK-55 TaxID=2835529 RepID=UPI001BCE3EB3|nr:glycosyltransferase family A protein [Flavobacterium sp. CYK-55]MBS7786408.1 glycosyltransferase family 2 protein [Flavobacterium sp. CYK-55]